MSISRSVAGRLFRVAVVIEYLFLMALPTLVVYYSFSPDIRIQFPPTGFTLRWFDNLAHEPRLLFGVWTSVVVASTTTLGALAIGIPAAIALERARFRGRAVLAAAFLSPLSLPGIVLALGLLMFLSRWLQPTLGISLMNGLFPLVIAHGIITTPWVIRSVSAGLKLMDPALEHAARGLGATAWNSFRFITFPLLRANVTTAAIFAFIVSFGNFSLSLFFSSGTTTTLPVAIFEYVDRFQDPTVAAAGSIVIVLTLALVVLAERFGGLSGVVDESAGRRRS